MYDGELNRHTDTDGGQTERCRRRSWPGSRLFRFPRYLGTRKRKVDLEPSDEREEQIFRTINSELKGLSAMT